MRRKFAVQLYTLRKECEQDFPATLRTLGEMGWAGVETAGLHGHSAEEIAGVLEESGLKTAGMHVSVEQLRSNARHVMAEARILGTNRLICPSVPHEWRNEEGYVRLREELNAAAAEADVEGFTVSFHNHAFEFDTNVDGLDALSYLIEPSANNAVLAEIDVYWLTKAGYEPAAFIERYGGRMPTMHLKDMTGDERRTYAEIGNGIIDFEPLLLWGELNGVEWYVVEQDLCEGKALDSVRISLGNLHALSDRLQARHP
ncbi:sugar phosphate isomerase/epimerase family protein [Paenibacillus sacheonensis]|uniref:TIM barrel protein n=1 Tax=Paenibacillus sacheonensis TaxID=742054 RepID=A0A7X5BXT1_9BACL|nr:TIM barrel protein [Paenibacillus sacheonensis]MBM7565940.1 sugar phosphate isomerase/epimerase [Paenibacillus sacheonensis]NBC68746.1 TIM barrel protein [Paenibacillus sacheonensis]